MDYVTLRDQILSWSNRNELTFNASIPTIIDLAMLSIYREIKCVGFQKVVSANMTAGIATIQKPQDFIESVSFMYTIPGVAPYSIFLLERSYEFCVAYAPNSLLRDKPIFYSTDLVVPPNNVAPAQIFISPTPDINYAYQFIYSTLPPLFNAQNPVNYVTDRLPDVLLFSCLMYAMPYLKSDERIPVFESLYHRAVQSTNNDSVKRYIDRISKRDKV